MTMLQTGGLTIVVPAYNCANHIVKCLDSLYRQDLGENFEIIVVNDCSTDSTRQVVSSYAQGKSNISLINHDENKKQGAARNTGLRAAKGDYVFFMDGDDWLSDRGLNHMLEIAKAKTADVVACGIQRAFSNGKTEPYHAWAFESRSLENNVKFFSECKIGAPAANKLYRRSFLSENNLFFIEPYYHEDVVFTAQVTLNCKHYISIDQNYYNYFWNESSTLNRAPTKLHLLSYLHLLHEMGKYTEKVNRLISSDVSLIKNLTTNYGTAEVLPKIRTYRIHHGRRRLEADIFECASQIFGGDGYYLAAMMLEALGPEEEPSVSLLQRLGLRVSQIFGKA